MECSPLGSCPWDSPGRNTAVDCHFLLQGILLTQGLNPGLLYCTQILYCLSYREVPYLFYKWKYIPFDCAESFSGFQLCYPMDYSLSGSSVHGDSPGKNTGVGCHALFQRIFPIQGPNPGLPHCRWILFCLSHQGSPEILEWVAMPSCRESSQPRPRTQVSHIAVRFFTSWTTGKSKNTGVGSLSLLQGNFLIQELNLGLLQCRQILYQLSYLGSPPFDYFYPVSLPTLWLPLSNFSTLSTLPVVITNLVSFSVRSSLLLLST